MGNETRTTTGSVVFVAAGSGIAALSGLLVIIISARVLSTEENTGFMTFWAALFAVFAVLAGVQSEMTRAVRAEIDSPERRSGSSPLRGGMLIGFLTAVVLFALYPLWERVFSGPGNPILPVLILSAAAVLYAGHVTVVGMLAGLGRWKPFAALTAAESMVRLVVALLAALLGWRVVGFEVAAASGVLTWLVVTTALPSLRQLWYLKVQLAQVQLLRRLLLAMAAAGANALLVTGFPLLMSLTTQPADYALAAPLIVAVSVTRTPLLIPIMAFQSMVIAAFVSRPAKAKAALAKLVSATVLVAVLGGVLAAFIGPALMGFVFGEGYENNSLLLGLLVLAAAFLALIVLGGSVALALDLHWANALGWYLALFVSIGLMFLPADLALRTVLGLAIGPLVGATLHFVFILRALARPGSTGETADLTQQDRPEGLQIV